MAPVVVARLLQRQRVHDGVAELDVLGGRDRVQILDRELMSSDWPSRSTVRLTGLADAVVEHGVQRHELGDVLAVDLDQDVADLAACRPRRCPGSPG